MNRLFPLFAFLSFAILISCNKKEANNAVANPAPVTVSNNYNPTHSARLAGPNYSQSISMDMANNMIQSYLTSVNYPYTDTALRALSFDADTMRAYLKDTRIVTLKFVMAHQVAYSQASFGKYAGMKPGALTMIIVGLDENNVIIRNSYGGFYEHFDPCPASCPGGSSDALLH